MISRRIGCNYFLVISLWNHLTFVLLLSSCWWSKDVQCTRGQVTMGSPTKVVSHHQRGNFMNTIFCRTGAQNLNSIENSLKLARSWHGLLLNANRLRNLPMKIVHETDTSSRSQLHQQVIRWKLHGAIYYENLLFEVPTSIIRQMKNISRLKNWCKVIIKCTKFDGAFLKRAIKSNKIMFCN